MVSDPITGAADLDAAHSRGACGANLVALAALAGLGAALLSTDRWFSYADDEIVILDVATDLAKVLGIFSGAGIHEHPPLYDLLIHSWIDWTGGEVPWVRAPAILFFLGGIWLCAVGARKIAGARAFLATVAVGALWPFGFHYGRLAGWFSLSFLMVAWVTVAYLALLKSPGLAHWLHVLVAAVTLVYTSYFGWAVLACLGAHLAAQREIPRRTRATVIIATISVTLAAFAPLLPAFWSRLAAGVGPRASLASAAANALFTYFSLFPSESIAPWYWALSIPAAALIAFLTWRLATLRGTGRSLFLCFTVLLVAMALLGVLFTKRVLLITPWLIIPLGLVTGESVARRRLLPSSALAAVFAVGWIGILDRSHYSSQRFVEPWRAVASDAVKLLEEGGLVIGDNYSFLFELTQALRMPASRERWQYRGLVGYEVHHPRVFRSRAWLEAGEPLAARVLVVKGQSEPGDLAAIGECHRALSLRCRLDSMHRLVPDTGYGLKARLFPSFHQIPWRVEIREYACE